MAAASGEGPQEMMDGERPPGAGTAAGWVGAARLSAREPPLAHQRSVGRLPALWAIRGRSAPGCPPGGSGALAGGAGGVSWAMA